MGGWIGPLLQSPRPAGVACSVVCAKQGPPPSGLCDDGPARGWKGGEADGEWARAPAERQLSFGTGPGPGPGRDRSTSRRTRAAGQPWRAEGADVGVRPPGTAACCSGCPGGGRPLADAPPWQGGIPCVACIRNMTTAVQPPGARARPPTSLLDWEKGPGGGEASAVLPRPGRLFARRDGDARHPTAQTASPPGEPSYRASVLSSLCWGALGPGCASRQAGWAGSRTE